MTWLIRNLWVFLIIVASAAAAYQDRLHPVKCFPVEHLPAEMR